MNNAQEAGISAKEIKLAKILMDKPAPHCSAQAWAIYDQKTSTLLFGRCERDRRECASLTKIMTAVVVLRLMRRFDVPESGLVTVGDDAAGVIGTSAELVAGDTLTVKQLLYGLLLPSGNDAGHQLAEYFGGLLMKDAEEREKKYRQELEAKQKAEDERYDAAQSCKRGDEAGGDLGSHESQRFLSGNGGGLQDKETSAQSSGLSDVGRKDERQAQHSEAKPRDGDDTAGLETEQSCKRLDIDAAVRREFPHIKKSPYVAKHSQFRNYPEVLHFLEAMNKTAEDLHLKGSFYDSPHGLANSQNKQTALDVAKLGAAAMKDERFREVVGSKSHVVKKNTNGNRKTYKWYNTHLMLGQRGINGIKTGITPAAGPCLATSISYEGVDLIVVIICTKNMDIRWSETWKLANWAIQRLKTIDKFYNGKAERVGPKHDGGSAADGDNDRAKHKRLLNRIRHL